MNTEKVLPLFILLALLPIRAKAQVTEGVRDSGRFHCDLDSFQKRPPLLLIGEDHCSVTSQQVKIEMVARGSKGSMFSALEGFAPWQAELLAKRFKGSYDKETSRLFGIESAFMYGLNGCHLQAIGALQQYRNAGGACVNLTPSRVFQSFLLLLQDNPYVRYVWEQVRDKENAFSGTELEPLARIFDQAMAAPSFDVLTPLAAGFTMKDAPNFMRLVRKMDAVYVALANTRFASEIGVGGSLNAIPEDPNGSFKDQWALMKFQTTLNTPLVHIRNRDMFDNIADIYCRAAEEGKVLAVSVGKKHLPGIEKRLKAWSKGRIPLKLADSDTEPGPILDYLESIDPTKPPSLKMK
ncbi:MAG: hypothetical protein WCU88_05225 [Elusimicrobiota bacterium]|jgi:hypothetical protein